MVGPGVRPAGPRPDRGDAERGRRGRAPRPSCSPPTPRWWRRKRDQGDERCGTSRPTRSCTPTRTSTASPTRPDREGRRPHAGRDRLAGASVTGLPVVVKGVLRADDARRAVDAGAAAVWVSNHGGRQLDRSDRDRAGRCPRSPTRSATRPRCTSTAGSATGPTCWRRSRSGAGASSSAGPRSGRWPPRRRSGRRAAARRPARGARSRRCGWPAAASLGRAQPDLVVPGECTAPVIRPACFEAASRDARQSKCGLTWASADVTAGTPNRFDVASARYVRFYLPRRKRRDARPLEQHARTDRAAGPARTPSRPTPFRRAL